MFIAHWMGVDCRRCADLSGPHISHYPVCVCVCVCVYSSSNGYLYAWKRWNQKTTPYCSSSHSPISRSSRADSIVAHWRAVSCVPRPALYIGLLSTKTSRTPCRNVPMADWWMGRAGPGSTRSPSAPVSPPSVIQATSVVFFGGTTINPSLSVGVVVLALQ